MILLKDVLNLFDFTNPIPNSSKQIGYDEETVLIRIFKDQDRWIEFGCWDYNDNNYFGEFLSHELLYTEIESLSMTEGTEDIYPILQINLK